MAMLKKLCNTCGRTCWHNPTKAGSRCTFCGYPANTGPKREQNETMIRRQATQPLTRKS